MLKNVRLSWSWPIFLFRRGSKGFQDYLGCSMSISVYQECLLAVNLVFLGASLFCPIMLQYFLRLTNSGCFLGVVPWLKTTCAGDDFGV